MTYRLLLFILLTTALSSCKRWQKQYPEDTERTKVTPLERLAGGKYSKWWTLSKVTLNGIDYTDSVKVKFGEYKVKLTRGEVQGNYDYPLYFGSYSSSIKGEYGIIWGLWNNDKDIVATLAHSDHQDSLPILIPSQLLGNLISTNSYTTIDKLQETELIISLQSILQDTIIKNYYKTY